MPWVIRHIASGKFVWTPDPSDPSAGVLPTPNTPEYYAHLRDSVWEATLFSSEEAACYVACVSDESEEVVDALRVVLTGEDR